MNHRYRHFNSAVQQLNSYGGLWRRPDTAEKEVTRLLTMKVRKNNQMLSNLAKDGGKKKKVRGSEIEVVVKVREQSVRHEVWRS